jgi:nicotinamide-nucleotide amidase
MYDRKLIEAIAEILVTHNETVAIAESVTSGHLQAALSLATGATRFFQGGVTAYNLVQKTKLLQIDPLHAVACNCVSAQVAEEMADGVLKMFNTDWSISITGYAATIPEAGINDLYSYFCVRTKEKIVLSKKIDATEKDLLKVQIFYTNTILQHFQELLNKRQR